MTTPTRYLAIPRPRPDARLRLFLLHHAGGSHAIFRALATALPDWIEPVLLCYPGRLALHRTPLPDSLEALAALMQAQIEPLQDRPYALFGHSMGALVAYRLAHRLSIGSQTAPVWLGVSAFEAPCRAARRVRLRSLHRYPDKDLRSHVKALGGTPETLLDDAAWRPFADLIRRDLALFERWQFDPQTATLSLPVQAFVGTEDPLVSIEGCRLWQYFSRDWQGLTALPGDHFYFISAETCFAEHLSDGLAHALDRNPPARTA